MSAYGALISLYNTIQNILNSYRPRPFHEILEAAYEELQLLQEILERLDSSSKRKSRKKVNALDGRMKQSLWNFEDLLETLLSDAIHKGRILYESNPSHFRRTQKLEEDALLTHLPQLHDAADSFIKALKEMKEEYIYEVNNMPDDDNDEAATTASSSSKMIGLSDEFTDVKQILYSYRRLSIMSYAIVGMGGLGKTTLARKIYEDPDIQRYFDCLIWITVGRLYDCSSQAFDLATRMQGGERCLIVLDDVWDTEVLPIFLISLLEVKDGRFIRILITARGRNIIRDFQKSILLLDSSIRPGTNKVLRLLDEDESKELLCDKVFGEQETCPPLLEKAAAKIAKNCEGLPLMIVTVAKHLSNNRSLDYWNEVAEEKNSVFTDSYEELSKVLFPSYDYLPQRLKMPFLFMGVFPRDYDSPMSKILNMLAAEGWFLEPNKPRSFHYLATECLEELCMSCNLVLFKKTSKGWFSTDCVDILKTCRLHSSWRHLCRREARKNKFFHVLSKLVDASSHSHSQQEEDDTTIKGQRGLCLENNILFGLKDFCSSVKSYCASFTRSLLFFGPYHQYPTSIDAIGFKLLRELDALQLRFYSFPTQVLTLFQLKYLALTCNQQLPTTISKLSKLQILIIHPHLSIVKCHTAPSFIPLEIWDMPELEHIEVLGKSLRPPNNINACLRKLKTLKGVNAEIGTLLELSKGIPYIRKLGVQMELRPYDTSSTSGDLILSCFDYISTLDNLKTLKCSTMNPVHVLMARSPAMTPSSLMVPSKLEKLHLSGMGFPWESMDAIASLRFLEELKLRCHAFRGPKWEIQEGSFFRVKYLAIEDSDLVEWKPTSGSFPQLSSISLKHCYKLKELDWSPGDIVGFAKIELVDCNPLAVACAKQLPSKCPRYLDVIASDNYQA